MTFHWSSQKKQNNQRHMRRIWHKVPGKLKTLYTHYWCTNWQQRPMHPLLAHKVATKASLFLPLNVHLGQRLYYQIVWIESPLSLVALFIVIRHNLSPINGSRQNLKELRLSSTRLDLSSLNNLQDHMFCGTMHHASYIQFLHKKRDL